MKPADVMKIEMTLEQADEVLCENRTTASIREEAIYFATRILSQEPTPAQAQAALVLAWNEILERSKLTYRRD